MKQVTKSFGTLELSQLTTSLLGDRYRLRAPKQSKLLAEVADRLVECYGTPTLGNFRDPIKEIFYIVLSARTNERLYQRAHRQLFERFPTLDAMASARISDMLKTVKVAGLGRKRASQIRAIAAKLSSDLGTRPQRRLRSMSADEVYRYLTRLPGVGPKSALCVMMCSLGYDVFPVDINVQRVLARVGTLPNGLKHYQAQKLGPRHVPAGRCKELHVGLVEHGRRVCVSSRPKCEACVLADICRYGRRAARLSRAGVA